MNSNSTEARTTEPAVITEPQTQSKPYLDARYNTKSIKARALAILEPLLISMYGSIRPEDKSIYLPNGWHVNRKTGAVWVPKQFELYGGVVIEKKCRNPEYSSDPVWLWTHWEYPRLALNENLIRADFRCSIERLEWKLIELESDPEVQNWQETKMIKAHEAFFGTAEPHQFYVLGRRPVLLNYLWEKGACLSGAELERWEKEGNPFMTVTSQMYASKNYIWIIESKLQRIVFCKFLNLSHDLPWDFTLKDLPRGMGRIRLGK
jgi:hypothetical protein